MICFHAEGVKLNSTLSGSMNCVATAAHDFVPEVPVELRLFVLLSLLNAAGKLTSRRPHTAMSERWTGATGICQLLAPSPTGRGLG